MKKVNVLNERLFVVFVSVVNKSLDINGVCEWRCIWLLCMKNLSVDFVMKSLENFIILLFDF